MGVLMGRGMEKGVVSLSPACGRSVVVLCWHRVVVVVRRHVASRLRVGASSSHVLAVSLCRGLRVVHLCCRLVMTADVVRRLVVS